MKALNKRAFIIVISTIFFLNFYFLVSNNNENLSFQAFNYQSLINRIVTRDFLRYECKNLKRIGGWPGYLKIVPHDLYRIDGAWYVCMDEGVKPIKNKCVVLSFGILDDASFDAEMNSNYKCQVESFDPYYINDLFRKKEYENVLTMNVNASWRYHKMGITGDSAKVTKNHSVGWIAKIEDILEYTQLKNKVIDVFKMDIENNEWSVLMNLDLDYACKYIKQFVLETHTELGQSGQFDPLKVLRKLEKCFLLFHRDTRFFYLLKRDKYGFYVTEFQDHKDYQLNLTAFDNEIKLINFMFTYGELYFVNRNFLE